MRFLGGIADRLARRRSRRGLAIGRRLTPEERAAEERAEDLLESVVGGEALAAYRVLGFLHSYGSSEADGLPGYGYLIYPHRPIVSFDTRSGEPLNELCVRFPDRTEEGAPERLPDADDVLAKWMALRGDELGLLAEANIDRPGTQIDPAQVRRDILRLQEWVSPHEGSASDGPGLAHAE
jgi:hypothetical protein